MGKRRLVLAELVFGALLACLSRVKLVLVEPILGGSVLDNQVNLLGLLLRIDGVRVHVLVVLLALVLAQVARLALREHR